MKRFLPLLVMLCSLASTTALATDASKLASYCKEFLAVTTDNVAPVTPVSPRNVGFCDGYFNAWADEFIKGEPLPVSEGGRVDVLLLVRPVRMREVVAEFITFLEENPKYTHDDAMTVITNAALSRGWVGIEDIAGKSKLTPKKR